MYQNHGRKRFKNQGRAMGITANIATSAVSRIPKNVMSTLPELITFYKTDKGLYLGNFVYIMVYSWNKE